MERLLEREEELGVLTGIVDGVLSGRGGIVLVGGEAGAGKTSLVRALRERVGDRVPVCVGGCEPLSVPVPLAPIRELLAVSGGDGAVVGNEDRLVLAGGLLARRPAVAVVEDAHWADPLTLDVVRILARRAERAGVGLIVTYRDDEVAANPGLGLLLGDLASRPEVRRIVLAPLSEPAVRELAGATGLDAAALSRATGGNPFLVVESIAAGGRMPASVRDAALARAGRLSGAARALVDVAAIAGTRVSFGLLAALVPESVAAVEEAPARGVLVMDGTLVGFRHELIREAIESAISLPRRASVHGRVLAALESGPDSADNARLAHHAELAGLAGPARRYARLAAADAQRVGALREVWLQSERALRHGGDLSVDERFDLLIQAAGAANFSSMRMADGAAVAERAVALADEIGVPAKRARARSALAWPLWSLDRLDEARAVAAEAVSILDDGADPGDLARAHATHLRIEAAGFDPEIVADAGPRALALAVAAGLDDVRIEIEVSLGLARGHLGDPAAVGLLRSAQRAALAAGLTIQTIRSYVNLAYVGAALRDHATVEATLREAVPMFEEAGAMFPLAGLRVYAAISPLDRGVWDQAQEMIDWSLSFGNELAPFARAIGAVIALRRGESSARAVLERSWAEMASLPECSRHGFVRVALAEAAWLTDDPGLALAQIRSARESPRTPHFARPYSDLALWARRLGLELEPPENAPAPVLLELGGDWRGAIEAWRSLDAPYDTALAALPGDDRAARAAQAVLHRLGAAGAARAFARERAAIGVRAPRGPRRSTMANRAGLTRREQEVLERVASGATNPEIAAGLCLSERTVAHHVSAILAKLGVPNRQLAIAQARERGLLAKDGPLREPI